MKDILKMINTKDLIEGQRIRIKTKGNTYEGIYKGTRKVNGSIYLILDEHKVYRRVRGSDYRWYDRGYRCSLDIRGIRKEYEVLEDVKTNNLNNDGTNSG